MFWPKELTETHYALVIDPSHTRFGEFAEVARQTEGALYLRLTSSGPLNPEEGVVNARVFVRKPREEAACQFKAELESSREEIRELLRIAAESSREALRAAAQQAVMKIVESIVDEILSPEETSCPQ